MFSWLTTTTGATDADDPQFSRRTVDGRERLPFGLAMALRLDRAWIRSLAQLLSCKGRQLVIDIVLDAATNAVADRTANLLAAEQAAAADLAAAANKTVTPEVEAYLKAKLEDNGILDYYRAP